MAEDNNLEEMQEKTLSLFDQIRDYQEQLPEGDHGDAVSRILDNVLTNIVAAYDGLLEAITMGKESRT